MAVSLCEETLFQGLVLCALLLAWGSSGQGRMGSVAVSALLFAALHVTHFFSYGTAPSSALPLALETWVNTFWWGALVLFGGSIWPAVMLHFAVNEMVAVQGLQAPAVEPLSLAYARLLLFSLPLGMLAGLFLQRSGLSGSSRSA